VLTGKKSLRAAYRAGVFAFAMGFLVCAFAAHGEDALFTAVFANAAIATSRVASQLCVGDWSRRRHTCDGDLYVAIRRLNRPARSDTYRSAAERNLV
jgi:hypothetical protein